MGVYGWHVLSHRETLIGTLVGATYSEDDQDWCFDVRPDPEYSRLLTSHTGKTNIHGFVECEVEPPFHIKGRVQEEWFREWFGWGASRRLGLRVELSGTWVTDCSHRFDDRDVDVTDRCGAGKTEIHPIVSMLIHWPPAPGQARKFELFVFSESASLSLPFRPILPPHCRENNRAVFRLPFPASVPGMPLDEWLQYRIDSDVDMCRGIHGEVRRDPNSDTAELLVSVESGVSDEGKGFYHGYAFVGPRTTLGDAECRSIRGRISDARIEIDRLTAEASHLDIRFPGDKIRLKEIQRETDLLKSTIAALEARAQVIGCVL